MFVLWSHNFKLISPFCIYQVLYTKYLYKYCEMKNFTIVQKWSFVCVLVNFTDSHGHFFKYFKNIYIYFVSATIKENITVMTHLTLRKSGFRSISSCRCRDVLARCGADDRTRYPSLNSVQLVLRHPFHIVGGCTY